MKPGRELDALIAEKVMGIPRQPFDPSKQFIIGMTTSDQEQIDWTMSCPDYSTDISAAWNVVEKLRSSGFGYCIEQAISCEKPTVWFVPKEQGPGIHVVEKIADAISDSSSSLSHAICLAALKAVGAI